MCCLQRYARTRGGENFARVKTVDDIMLVLVLSMCSYSDSYDDGIHSGTVYIFSDRILIAIKA